MGDLVRTRLAEERKNWRKDHPIGFFARPSRMPDGSTNLLLWEAGIPGKTGTPWEKGVYNLKIHFSEDYPTRPPDCTFTPVLFHPNIYPSGRVCLSILDEGKAWKPSITLKQILLGIQDLLDSPNNNDPAQRTASQLYATDPAEYERRVRAQAEHYSPNKGGDEVELIS